MTFPRKIEELLTYFDQRRILLKLGKTQARQITKIEITKILKIEAYFSPIWFEINKRKYEYSLRLLNRY